MGNVEEGMLDLAALDDVAQSATKYVFAFNGSAVPYRLTVNNGDPGFALQPTSGSTDPPYQPQGSLSYQVFPAGSQPANPGQFTDYPDENEVAVTTQSRLVGTFNPPVQVPETAGSVLFLYVFNETALLVDPNGHVEAQRLTF